MPKKLRKKSLVGWTTKWGIEHFPLPKLYRTKKELRNSPKLLTSFYQPIKVRITITEIK